MATKPSQILANEAAVGTPYFTPKQLPVAGTAVPASESSVPKLFQPLTIRGVTFQNRIFLSPLCQYSAKDGIATDWHLTHLGGILQRGPGLTFVEATAIAPEGRITPECLGLWSDEQMQPLQRIVVFAHSQGQKIGIQLAHAGRKGSTIAPWLDAGDTAAEQAGGWPKNTKAPSAIRFHDKFPLPLEMTVDDIENFKDAFEAAVKRAVQIGFDVIEIHNAHGYLLHEFLSPVANKRSDEYGGSWENRTRLTLEVVDVVRRNMPPLMPLFLRISASDCLEGVNGFEESWTNVDTINLAKQLALKGVDLLDVSSGGLHPSQHIQRGPGYQVPFSRDIKAELRDNLLVGAVGTITTGIQANKYLEEDGIDVIFLGRTFQKNPGMVWAFAEDLGQDIVIANQIRWGFAGRGIGPQIARRR